MIVVVASLVGNEHDKVRRRDRQEGQRWGWSVNKAIREVHVVVWVGDR